MKASLIRLSKTESTNSYAIGLLSKKRPEEGCVITATHQTKGKGHDTNSWESEAGKNLTFSLILYPTFAVDRQFLLNKAVSLGIYDCLNVLLPEHPIHIKWPNDIYIGDKKVCGILIQNSVVGNSFDYVVAGIGFNVNQTHFVSDAPNPVSLKGITGIDYDAEQILEKLLTCIFYRYEEINSESGIKIENDYSAALYRMMQWHEYSIKGHRVRARITGTNAYGQLLLETETEHITVCDIKEVKFII